MMRRCAAAAVALALVAAAPGAIGRSRAPEGSDALDAFVAALSPADATARIDDVLKSGASFGDVYRRLQRGRAYQPQPSGVVRDRIRTASGTEHQYAVNIPANYDPGRAYPLRFQLHGGVMMRHSNTPPAAAGPIGALASDEDQFYVLPFAWDESPWWSDEALASVRATLDAVKRRYNIDENRVVVSGVSDGGTGVYYIAMRDTTPFAGFLPLNGFWGVLANHDLQVDGPLYPNNLRNKPLFVVNGERDPLYPTSIVEPAIEHYRKIGVSVDYLPQAGAGHNTQWWLQVKSRFEAFVRTHARNPLPDRLTWETTENATVKRAHWLVIDEVGAEQRDDTLDDPNLIASPPRLDFGVLGSGNRILKVLPESNAERIGLRAGDALVRVNGESARVSISLNELFERLEPGKPITLLVARGNAPVELSGVYQPKTVTDPPHAMFDDYGRPGRVDLTRTGNTIVARTRGVRAFTLLLSPDQLDFAKPLKVVVNGRTLFDGRVTESMRTLLKWAAIDNDRTMLFGAELPVRFRTRD
jgi:predicted esterase